MPTPGFQFIQNLNKFFSKLTENTQNKLSSQQHTHTR